MIWSVLYCLVTFLWDRESEPLDLFLSQWSERARTAIPCCMSGRKSKRSRYFAVRAIWIRTSPSFCTTNGLNQNIPAPCSASVMNQNVPVILHDERFESELSRCWALAMSWSAGERARTNRYTRYSASVSQRGCEHCFHGHSNWKAQRGGGWRMLQSMEFPFCQ